MKNISYPKDFNKLPIEDKRKFVKSLINNYEVKDILVSLINNNNNLTENFEIINSVCNSKVFKSNTSITRLEVISCLINLYFNNNIKELEKYFNNLDKNKLKKILDNEESNKTNFSRSSLFIKLNNNFSEEVLPVKKKKILDKEINSKKAKVGIFFILFIIVMIICYILVGYCYYIISYYNNHIYPNMYLNDKLVSGYTGKELMNLLDENENLVKNNFVLKNENSNYTYSYESVGVFTNKSDLVNKMINDYKKLNGYEKLYKIFFDSNKYEFKYDLNEDKYNLFMDDLKSKVNVSKKQESFSIVNGNISYVKGISGFVLNEENLKDQIMNSIKEDNTEIELSGSIDKVNNVLGLINKKVSTFTTYYNESQGRAKNIRNAVSKINGRILYSGDTFSFYRAAGPYNGSRGYIFYAKDVGSGVCQVSTTIYNAALLLNLPIISRENHGDMVYYVDYGMDATVYGSYVDMKFRNNTNYPIYIEAHANGGTLTVSLWSNENIVPAGYSYKPRVVHLGGLSYKTYLDTYYNGEKIDSKYLNSSYYVKGK